MTTPRASRPSPAALDEAVERLRAGGLRVTGPRQAILRLLIAEHGPFTIEEIHRRLRTEGHRGCDLVTVYRVVSALEELGLARRCEFGDGVSRYEHNAPGHHHHHLVCRVCRRVETLELCVAGELEQVARDRGYADVGHTLEIFGICPRCARRAPRRAGRATGVAPGNATA